MKQCNIRPMVVLRNKGGGAMVLRYNTHGRSTECITLPAELKGAVSAATRNWRIAIRSADILLSHRGERDRRH